MSSGTQQKALPPPPSDHGNRWRRVAVVVTAVAVALAIGAIVVVLRSDSPRQSAGSTATPSGQPAQPSAQPSGRPSAQPSRGGPTASVQPPVAAFGYQPLWPFAGVADAAAWQRSYRSGGHQPWHLDAGLTALSFTRTYLGYQDIDRVVDQTTSGTQAWVTVGYAAPNGAAAPAAVVHLARIGTGQDAPWEVVGTRDTTLTLTRPGYGTTVTPPVTVGGWITGVDESLSVQVRALGEPVLAKLAGIPAGGVRSPWSVRVGFTAPIGTVVTIAVSTGGHTAAVEEFAITGVRVGTR